MRLTYKDAGIEEAMRQLDDEHKAEIRGLTTCYVGKGRIKLTDELVAECFELYCNNVSSNTIVAYLRDTYNIKIAKQTLLGYFKQLSNYHLVRVNRHKTGITNDDIMNALFKLEDMNKLPTVSNVASILEIPERIIKCLYMDMGIDDYID